MPSVLDLYNCRICGMTHLVCGVEEPDLGDMGRQCPGGSEWATSQLSIMCRLAFLEIGHMRHNTQLLLIGHFSHNGEL